MINNNNILENYENYELFTSTIFANFINITLQSWKELPDTSD